MKKRPDLTKIRFEISSLKFIQAFPMFKRQLHDESTNMFVHFASMTSDNLIESGQSLIRKRLEAICRASKKPMVFLGAWFVIWVMLEMFLY